MRLILHPDVRSDVNEIMAYYERIAGPELADDFYSELRQFMLDAAERPESFPFASAVSTCIVSLTIFFFASSVTRCGFWLSDITEGIRRR